MKKIRFVNWQEYQHYKDRAPPWIKLHFSILSSRHWIKLDESGKLLAIVCMMLASRNAGEVECDEEYIMAVGNLKKRPDFDALVDCGFCEYCDGLLDGCKHDASNLQQGSVSTSNLSLNMSSDLEKSKIDGFEGSKKDVDDHDANLIYAAYPRKVARKLAMRAIIRAMEKTPAELLIVLTRQYAEARRGQDENFTPHPSTWFNQERFNDAPETWKPKPAEQVKQENETPKWKKLEILKEHVSKFTAQNPHPDRWTQEQRDTLKKNREEIKKLEMEMVK